MLDGSIKIKMFKKARNALSRAYAPYSGVFVAAAVLDDNGEIHIGVNVENASYGLTICAERNAIANAVSNGMKKIAAILIVSNKGAIAPCGACRQVIWEFVDNDAPVFLADCDGIKKKTTIAGLLPEAFDKSDLKGKKCE